MFHLIVTCVGKKKLEGPSITTAIDNLIRKGINNDVSSLFEEWTNILQQPTLPRQQAIDVYAAALWSASCEAYNTAKSCTNNKANLWIISCGYGLINHSDKITGYCATFKANVCDSLYQRKYFGNLNPIDLSKRWWDLLMTQGILQNTNRPKSIHDLVNNLSTSDEVLIAAGKEYYEAIYNDLNQVTLRPNGPKIALVGIKHKNNSYIPSIPSNLIDKVSPYCSGKRLREFLHCSAIQLQSKSANYLIKRYFETGEFRCEFP